MDYLMKTVLRKYRFRNNVAHIKKAAITTFTEPIDEALFSQCSKRLQIILKNAYDAYLFKIEDLKCLTPYTLKLLVAFANTFGGKGGLIVSEKVLQLALSLSLDSLFMLESDEGHLLMELEKSKQK